MDVRTQAGATMVIQVRIVRVGISGVGGIEEEGWGRSSSRGAGFLGLGFWWRGHKRSSSR